MRHDRRQQPQQNRQAFLDQRPVAAAGLRHRQARQLIEHLHAGRHDGVELVLVKVVAGLLQTAVDFAPCVALRIVQRLRIGGRRGLPPGAKIGRERPQALQKTIGTGHALVGPFQRLVRGRGKNDEQPRRVRAVAVDQRLRIDRVALGLGHLGAVLEHHALREQARERLAGADQALVAHQLGKEARVQQVQDGVLDAADVLVHRQPLVGALIQHGRVQIRTGKAREVPGRLEEGVEGVRLAPRRRAALRAGGLVELGHARQRRARAVDRDVLGQAHRQLRVRHRHGAAGITVDDRNRAAPVALARHAPVAQAVLHAPGADAARFGQVRDGVEGRLKFQSVVRSGVDQQALVGERGVFDQAGRIAVETGRRHHRPDRQPVLAGEFPVALVVAGHGHDGALAVVHQHEVGHPHRHRLAGQRMHGAQAGVDAEFFLGLQRRLAGLAGFEFFDGISQRRVAGRHLLRQRMLGGHRHVGGAVQRVRARGEYLQRPVTGHLEAQFHAHRAADPVALHGLDRLRPVQAVQVRQQLVGIGRDAQEPLRNLAPLDQRAGAPAAAVDDLLVGQHGLVDRIPVDRRQPAVGQAFLEQAREQPLFPAVVLGPAGGDLAPPVVGKAQALQLRAHVGDVVVGPARRRDAALDGGVLGRHAEGVPAHRLQHAPALHHLKARQHVADGVIAHVAHVQRARRVREHGQAVELLARAVVGRREGVILLPPGLDLGFDRGGVVLAIHEGLRKRRQKRPPIIAAGPCPPGPATRRPDTAPGTAASPASPRSVRTASAPVAASVRHAARPARTAPRVP